MSTPKKAGKNTEDLQAALQSLIAQGRKDGMIRATDLNALLEKMVLSPEKIEEIYDRFEAMNIQVVTADLELDLGDDMDLVGDGDIDLVSLEEEDLVDPVDLAGVQPGRSRPDVPEGNRSGEAPFRRGGSGAGQAGCRG